MSALAVFVLAHGVHIITDGAAYDKAGVLGAFVQKVTPLPHLGIAIAGRGSVDVLNEIRSGISYFSSLDDLKAGLAPGLLATYGEKVRTDPDHFHFDLVIAGHADDKPFAWIISSWPEREDIPPFELVPIAFGWFSPAMGNDLLQRLSPMLERDPGLAAAAILKSQRKAQDVPVGGYGQVTTITRAGFNTRMVCRWNDRIGDKIEGAR